MIFQKLDKSWINFFRQVKMTWIRASKGIRYKEHVERKNGLKPDRYYSAYFKVDGKQIEQGLGWGTEGMTLEKAESILHELKHNCKTADGAKTLKEKRAAEHARRLKESELQAEKEKSNITFKAFFEGEYLPIQKMHKDRNTWVKEEQHANNWLYPIVGGIPVKDICAFHLEKIKKAMLDAGRTPRTIQYCFATFRQTWNHARREGILSADSPTRNVKIPKFDNQRQRYLTPDECKDLLDELRKHSTPTYYMAVISLDAGLRFSEIAGLQWQDVDTVRKTIFLRDTKSGRNRTVYMTNRVKSLFAGMQKQQPDSLIFPDSKGGRMAHISKTFDECVERLGLNSGIDDDRLKCVFHTLRHTHASRLLESGTDIYRVKELLGHANVTTTERYSHVTADRLRSAVANMERMNNREAEIIPIPISNKR